MDSCQQDIIAIATFFVGLLGLFVSVVVLFITYKTWKLKCGQSVRASYGIASSIAADGPYVCNVIIENLKDKEVCIFGIYLRLGANFYLDLLDIDDIYDKYNHIIPPLSTRIFELGAPIYYHKSAREVNITSLLREYKHKGQIILATNHGKIVAKKFKKGWSPISQGFKNYDTIYVRPARLYCKSAVPYAKQQSEHYIDYSSIEKTFLYVVELLLDSGKTFEFKISNDEKSEYVLFQKLTFSPTILSSVDNLRNYLLKSRDENLLSFRDILNIIDIQALISSDKKRLLSSEYEITSKHISNKFQYYVLGKLRTWLYNIKNPCFPSKLFSLYCLLGLRNNPNKMKCKKNNNE